MIERCTGSATSTFGGGGGTKLFCSQALKVANANATNTRRAGLVFRSRTKLFSMDFADLESVDVRACLMSRPRVKMLSKTAIAARRSSFAMNSNNLLAVEPESENDAPAKVVTTKLF
ncbi:hypothetical protein [Bradyrhizobium jicamae]|uniref:hypothetical protein n=1 Tax=Bradyrhizobium jicamae TaxID=280332 RepID=UPI0032DE9A89